MPASLGWGLLDLADELVVPSGEFYGRPLTLTDEQAQWVLDWYAVDEEGRFLNRRGAIRRPKGAGKSPFGAFYAFCELVGNVRFLEFDGKEAVGRPCPSPWVQIAAVSEDQTDNTYVALYEMLRESDAVHRYGLDVGLTRIYKVGQPGSRIEPVTSSSGSREGQPITAAVLDQTESWTKANGGVRLAATIRRNAAKMGGRTLEIPNAHTIGDGTVAEETFKSWEKGAPGLWYSFTEAPEVEDFSDHDAVVEALKVSYGDAVKWVDLHRIADEIADPATDPADAVRFYFNRPATETNRAVDMRRWSELATERIVEPGERIAVGFDGSISDDMTVLWGCTEDRFLFEIAAWGRPATAGRDWRVPRSEVHDTVAEVMARYDVGLMLCDPPKWYSELEEWERLYGDRVAQLPTNSAAHFAPACDLFATSVREGSVSHDGSDLLTRHLAATARKKVRINDDDDDGRSKFVFVKAATAKIDATVAAVLALRAVVLMPEDKTVNVAQNVW